MAFCHRGHGGMHKGIVPPKASAAVSYPVAGRCCSLDNCQAYRSASGSASVLQRYDATRYQVLSLAHTPCLYPSVSLGIPRYPSVPLGTTRYTSVPLGTPRYLSVPLGCTPYTASAG